MPTAVAGGRDNAPPHIAPHIHQHHIAGEKQWPQRVVLLAPLQPRDTHYLTARGGERSRSVPCEGDGCPHCASAKTPKRVNYYGPALLHKQAEDGGPSLWVRVVLYVPHAALKWFTNVRGAAHHCWKTKSESDRGNRVVATCVGFCHEITEPSFDVQPVLDLVWSREGGAEAVRRLREQLPPNVTPPVFHRPKPTPPADGGNYMTRDELMQVLRQAGLVREPKADPKSVDTVKNSFTFQGKTLAEREADGTSKPGQPADREGGGK